MVKRSCEAASWRADAVGLGDVGHGGHPPGVLAVGIDQRRDVQAGIKAGAVLALHPHLKAAGHSFASTALP